MVDVEGCTGVADVEGRDGGGGGHGRVGADEDATEL